MADVFISYKKEDRNHAELVAQALSHENFTVWWDDHLTPENEWDSKIERELADAGAVVVLWTPRSAQSDWVRREAHYAQERNKLVPVMVEDCTLPLAFTLRQTIGLVGWRGESENRSWRKLLTWVADITATKLGNSNLPQALAGAQPNRFRRIVGQLPSGDEIVDGAFVNSATPAGTVFRDAEGLPIMRILPAGFCVVGSPESDPDSNATERPQRRVEIFSPIAMGVFPILVGEFTEIMKRLPADVPSKPARPSFLQQLKGRGQRAQEKPVKWVPEAPMTMVSFDEAAEFAERLSGLTEQTYRLPSETEWEYACRAGSGTRYSCGQTIDETQAWFANKQGACQPGRYRPNAYGLYDMHGNVREWTQDLWHESHNTVPLDGSPLLDGHSSMRVVRGGGWCDQAPILRSAARMRATQFSQSDAIGFRLARLLM